MTGPETFASLRVEVITISIGYGDFLRETLPVNLPLVDDLIVITTEDDAETREVCRRHSVHHVLTDDHKRNGEFNKARLINRALDQIGAKDWVLHLDADIVLPRKYRQYLDWAHLDPQAIYGADRCNLVGWDKWQNLKKYVGAWDNHAHECGHWFHPEFPVGSRWVSKLHGYVPIGAFQLFHGSQTNHGGYHVRRYPVHHGNCARSDIQFALQWDRRHRLLLPEVIVLHLESEDSDMGANWEGRTSKRFGPPWVPPPNPSPY